ncbi:MAG: putative polymerase subfamily sigma factor [Acidimicrobiales bacterium]|nr:putative polymerase subfamily sigma factor [Acidimicrobiales bacterium]
MATTEEFTISSSDEQIWLSFSEELTRYARVLVGSDDAHDVVATAFLRVSRRGWSEVREPRAYLYRAVANEAHNHRRQRQRRWARDVHALLPATSPSAADERDHDDVRRAVDALSVRQRSVVYLAYWRDLGDREIADLLDLSTSSVRRHLDRARVHLRKALR